MKKIILAVSSVSLLLGGCAKPSSVILSSAYKQTAKGRQAKLPFEMKHGELARRVSKKAASASCSLLQNALMDARSASIDLSLYKTRNEKRLSARQKKQLSTETGRLKSITRTLRNADEARCGSSA